MRHVISILLQNESGALSRVATMFASRGFNIESLNVAPTQDPTVSRVTLVTVDGDVQIAQINKQLGKLIDVVAIEDRTTTDHIERELGLIKLRVHDAGLASLRGWVRDHDARVLDDDAEHFTVEITGDEREIDRCVASLPPGADVLTVIRSGSLVISRGPHSLGEEPVG